MTTPRSPEQALANKLISFAIADLKNGPHDDYLSALRFFHNCSSNFRTFAPLCDLDMDAVRAASLRHIATRVPSLRTDLTSITASFVAADSEFAAAKLAFNTSPATTRYARASQNRKTTKKVLELAKRCITRSEGLLENST